MGQQAKSTARLIIVWFAIIALMMGLVPTAAGAATPIKDETPAGYMYVSVERFTTGQGFVFDPVKVPYYGDEKADAVLDRACDTVGVERRTDAPWGYYLSAIRDNPTTAAHIPRFITDAIANAGGVLAGRAEADWLASGDYYSDSGWNVGINDSAATAGLSDIVPHDGDVLCVQFSIFGYGSDIGIDNSSWGGSPALIAHTNRSDLIRAVATVNSAENRDELLAVDGGQVAYENALSLLENLESSQTEIDAAYAALRAIKVPDPTRPSDPTTQTSPPVVPDNLKKVLAKTAAYQASQLPADAGYGYEWTVLALARAGLLSEANKDAYLAQLKADTASILSENKGALNPRRLTENARVILTLTALGVDARNFAGSDLVAPLSDFDTITAQGVNGVAYALLALDSGAYSDPRLPTDSASTQTTRKALIDYLLATQQNAGGWALAGAGIDADVTALVLQALAPYYKKGDVEVEATVETGLAALSAVQDAETGGFGTTYEGVTTLSPESNAQVLIALSALGISYDDPQFTKNSKTIYDALLSFALEPAAGQLAFSHVAGGSTNAMATEQALLAFVALSRAAQGQTTLYDMSDLTLAPVSPKNETNKPVNTNRKKQGTNTPSNVDTMAETSTLTDTGDAVNVTVACATLCVAIVLILILVAVRRRVTTSEAKGLPDHEC